MTTTRSRRRKTPKITDKPKVEQQDTRRRVFLAVPLPPEVTTFVDTTIVSLRKEDWPMRWTATGNAHVTVHFLGEIEPEVVELVRLSLPPVVARHEAFALRTANLGVFPALKRPRVIWLGLYGPAHRLQTLRDAIGEHLTSLDIALDDREFHPHITLGRVRDTPGTRVRDLPEAIRARFAAAEESGEVTHKRPLPIPITEVHLVESHLGPNGPVYEVIDRFPLDPGPSTD